MKHRSRGRKRRGFTLIELVVVIAILALLLAIAIPAYAGYRDRADDQAHAANVRMLENAAMLKVSEGVDNFSWTGADDEDWGSYLKDWPKTREYTVQVEDGEIHVDPPADETAAEQ